MKLNRFAYLYSKPLGNHSSKNNEKKFTGNLLKNLEKSWKYHGILSVQKSGNPVVGSLSMTCKGCIYFALVCADTPLGRHPLGRHLLGRYPLSRHPLGRHPRADTPEQTPPWTDRQTPTHTHTPTEADTPWADTPSRRPLQRTVRILLECILVLTLF